MKGLHSPTKPSCFWALIVIALSLPPLGFGQTKKGGDPEKNLPPNITQLTGFGERAAWSPDGKWFAFQSARNNEPAGVGHGIFLYKLK
jgi:WD40-like Beta Propeller Repeat